MIDFTVYGTNNRLEPDEVLTSAAGLVCYLSAAICLCIVHAGLPVIYVRLCINIFSRYGLGFIRLSDQAWARSGFAEE